jgi:hypothetical protein
LGLHDLLLLLIACGYAVHFGNDDLRRTDRQAYDLDNQRDAHVNFLLHLQNQ